MTYESNEFTDYAKNQQLPLKGIFDFLFYPKQPFLQRFLKEERDIEIFGDI